MSNNQTPRASYSLKPRTGFQSSPGKFGKFTTAIGRGAGNIERIDVISIGKVFFLRDNTAVNASPEKHDPKIISSLENIDGVKVFQTLDRTFLMHPGVKIVTVPKVSFKSSPGFVGALQARHCSARADDDSESNFDSRPEIYFF